MRRILFSACFLILSAAVLGRAEEYEIKLGEEEDQYGVLVRSSEAVNIQGFDVTFTWTEQELRIGPPPHLGVRSGIS